MQTLRALAAHIGGDGWASTHEVAAEFRDGGTTGASEAHARLNLAQAEGLVQRARGRGYTAWRLTEKGREVLARSEEAEL